MTTRTHRQKPWFKLLLLAMWLPGFFNVATTSVAEADDVLGTALRNGKIVLDMRYRLEIVSQDGIDDNAAASTLRTRLGYRSGAYRGLFGYGEFEAVSPVGRQHYNSTSNGLTQYPVVADPKDAEINQAFLAYKGKRGLLLKLGRQRIILDNARFIGNVGWRQNEQTFDAFSLRVKPVKDLSLFYAHLNNANRIFGAHHPDPRKADLKLFADLLHVTGTTALGTAVGYAYLIGNEDNPAASQRTIGVRFNGSHRCRERFVIVYTAEYADQAAYRDGAASNDAAYYRLDFGGGIAAIKAQVGIEVLGGDGTYGFSTPLATLHSFNGWADQFLATPRDGLEDRTVSLLGMLSGFKWLAVYHDYSANDSDRHYGSELGLLCSRAISKMYLLRLKFANYNADRWRRDTQKFWLGMTVKI